MEENDNTSSKSSKWDGFLKGLLQHAIVAYLFEHGPEAVQILLKILGLN